MAALLLSGAAAANADTIYQVTIYPDFVTNNNYPPGEGTVNFTSNEFNPMPDPPPEWSEIQLTFSSTPAALIANQGIVASTLQNLTIEMPQLSGYAPVPPDDNLVSCDNIASPNCWGGTVLYVSTLEYPSLSSDELYLQIDNGLHQEWDIYVYFAPGATGIGTTTSVDVSYLDDSGTASGLTSYCGPDLPGCSAVGVVIPEPASLWFALAGFVCLPACHKAILRRSASEQVERASAVRLAGFGRMRAIPGRFPEAQDWHG